MTRRTLLTAAVIAPAVVPITSAPTPVIKLYTTPDGCSLLALIGAMNYSITDDGEKTFAGHMCNGSIKVYIDLTREDQMSIDDVFVGKLVVDGSSIPTENPDYGYMDRHVVPINHKLTGRWLAERAQNLVNSGILPKALRLAKEYWPDDQRLHLSLMS